MEYLTAVIPSPLIQILRLEEIEPTSEVRDPSSWRVVSSESRNLGSKASDRGHYSSFQLDCWRFSPKLRGDIFPARISLRTQIPSRRSSSPRKNGKIGVQMESLRPEIAIEVLVGWGGGGGDRGWPVWAWTVRCHGRWPSSVSSPALHRLFSYGVRRAEADEPGLVLVARFIDVDSTDDLGMIIGLEGERALY